MPKSYDTALPQPCWLLLPIICMFTVGKAYQSTSVALSGKPPLPRYQRNIHSDACRSDGKRSIYCRVWRTPGDIPTFSHHRLSLKKDHSCAEIGTVARTNYLVYLKPKPFQRCHLSGFHKMPHILQEERTHNTDATEGNTHPVCDGSVSRNSRLRRIRKTYKAIDTPAQTPPVSC